MRLDPGDRFCRRPNTVRASVYVLVAVAVVVNDRPKSGLIVNR